MKSSTPDVVVYDSSRGRVVARHALDGRRTPDASARYMMAAVAGREVFVARVSRGGVDPFGYRRLALDSGAVDVVDESTVRAAVSSVPRALLAGGYDPEHSVVILHGDPTPGIPDVVALEVENGERTPLFDPDSGDRLDLRPPAELADSSLWPTQWLDDDHLVVAAGNGADGDLLTCRLSTGRCEVTVASAIWDPPPLLPGYGGLGADLALLKAVRD